MQETAADEVVAEVLRLGVAEDDIAVAGHMDKGVVEELGAANIDSGGLGLEAHLLVGVAEGYEVWQRRGVGIPVATAAVFKQGQLRLGAQCEW